MKTILTLIFTSFFIILINACGGSDSTKTSGPSCVDVKESAYEYYLNTAMKPSQY